MTMMMTMKGRHSSERPYPWTKYVAVLHLLSVVDLPFSGPTDRYSVSLPSWATWIRDTWMLYDRNRVTTSKQCDETNLFSRLYPA